MARLLGLGLALIAAAAPAALAPSARAQEVGAPAGGGGAASTPPPSAAVPAVQDVTLDIGGIRARVVLRRGAALEGLLPLGAAHWEKASYGADYEEVGPADPAAGLRLYFVLGMEGAIFLRKSDIAEVKDLGAITDEAAAALRQNLLDARRRALLEKEARLRESLVRILGTDKVEEAMPAKAAAAPAPAPVEGAQGGGPAGEPGPDVPPAPPAAPPAPAVSAPAAAPAPAPAAGPVTREDEARAKAEARRRRGDELLEKYPPPDWSEKRLETILWRESVAKIPPDEVEAPFVKESDLWIEALRRREAAERKAAAPAPAPGGGSPPAPSPSPR